MRTKIVWLFVALFIQACGSTKALVERISLPNGQKGYSVDCTNFSWSNCFVEAGNTCPDGYRVFERSVVKNVKSEIPVENLAAATLRNARADDKYMIIYCKTKEQ